MVEIISVRFKEGGKQYYFNPNGERFPPGGGGHCRDRPRRGVWRVYPGEHGGG